MNEVVLIGNLTKDPEVRRTQNDTSMCRFTLAVNDKKKNPATGQWEDNACFIPIVVFGKQAENCGRYLAKGRKVAIKGRIQTGSYEKDGQKIYTTDIIAASVEFLSQASDPQPAQQVAVQQAPAQNDIPVGFEEVTQEEIPFF